MTATRRDTALVLGTGLILFFLGLGNHDLWNPNEPVFAEGAREMLERGEWLVPYVNGRLYVDKPILFFWAILAGSLPAAKVTAWSARLPSAVAALLTLWAVLRFGRRAFGRRAALIAGLALATMGIFVWEARFAQMDPMLTLFMFLCLATFQRAREGDAARWLAASGAWAGLAFLTKGPVGLVLPGATALVVLVWDRDLRFLLRPAWLAGAGAFALVGLPWYVAVGASGHGEWLAEFFLRQNLGRFTDPFDHARPFWYYGPRFLSDLFPWSLLLPLVLLDRPAPGVPGRETRAWRLCLAYVGVTLAFFSLSGAKRGVYILPLYPAYALLVGRLWDRGLAGDLTPRRERVLGVLTAVAGVALATIGILLPLAVARHSPEFSSTALPLGILAFSAGAAILVPAARRNLRVALLATVTGLAVVYVVASVWVAPRVDARKSARAFSERVLTHVPPEAPLCSFRFWKWRSEYIFYTERLMPILDDEEVQRYLARPEPVYLLVKDRHRDRLEELVTTPLYALVSAEVGDDTVYLYSNRPAAPDPGGETPPEPAGPRAASRGDPVAAPKKTRTG